VFQFDYNGSPWAWSSGRKSRRSEYQSYRKGDAITWTDRISGYSVSEGAEGFNFTARRNGKVQVTAKYDEIPHGSKFVLTDIGD
jgi:hypothetical protein